MSPSRQSGFTLAEQAMTLLVLVLVLGAIASVMSFSESRSVDPVLERQGLSLAEAYLEEVLSKSYLDPDDGNVCPAPEAERDAYDNLCDFSGLTVAGAVFPDGTVVPGLDDFMISIDIVADGSAQLGPLTGFQPGTSNTVPATIRVDVSLIWQEKVSIVITGYRSAPPA